MLSRMLIRIADRARANFAEAVAPFGLPIPLARALLALHEPSSMRSIADFLACDPSYVTGLADQLEERGLVTRQPGADRRIKLVILTPAGHELRERMAEAVYDHGRFAPTIPADKRVQLREILEQLLEDQDKGVRR